MRSLASQSGEAAVEVERVIGAAREGIEQVHTSASTLEASLGGVGEVTAESREALASLVRGIEELNESFAEVAREVEAHSASLETLATSAQSLQRSAVEGREHAQRIAAAGSEQIASTQELAGASEHLADLAARLDTLTGRFRTSAGDDAAERGTLSQVGRHKLGATLRAAVSAE